MGTTRVKVIDLSSDEKQIKTSRKHAQKLTSAAIVKEDKDKKPKRKIEEHINSKPSEAQQEQVITKSVTEEKSAKKEEIDEKLIEQKPKVEKKDKAQKSLYHQGKKYKAAKKIVEEKPYKIKDALEILPNTSITNFDPSVEIHLNVVDKNIKGSVNFPNSFATKQKNQKYLVFGEKKEIKGDIIWGDEKTINDIEAGTLKAGRDFDIILTSAVFMPKLAKIAKIIGPKGLMPNPKNGTITEDFEKVISSSNNSGYSYMSDPMAPIIHAKIGKLSQNTAELEANLKTLTTSIGVSKIKKATLSSTMGPSVILDIASL